ncbi:hypothetical protein COB11_02500 [Candidatus Aerophobetes bacterium]|uniref:Uncharacterized protein n=1 Tax=Aerophobetes bacterium TaxID=2030807 RepID=A0A2A4YM24_UNCAE|nr:MAG: hypothetical protein COB11_02500 [Candidatus Aerophobetes bacterium]
MLDLPPEQFQGPKTEIEQIIAEAAIGDQRLKITKAKEEDTYTYAKEILGIFSDGFQWSDFVSMIRSSFEFVQKNQDLTVDEQKEKILSILSHVVDLTDTPHLPDSYTDPLFKSMIPPIVDIVTKASNGQFQLIPALSGEVPNSHTFKDYIAKTKEAFTDGFQWTDLSVITRHTIEFVSGFPGLTLEKKKSSVVEIVHGIIDSTDTPYLPDTFIDPIFKSITGPTVDLIFEKLGY